MPSRLTFLLAILSVSTTTQAADVWVVAKPPRTASVQRNVDIPDSVVTVPISLKTQELAAEIVKAYATEPLYKGTTNRVSAKALVNREVTVEKWVKTMVTPEVPCETKLVPISIKVGVVCWNPFKKKCRDVFRQGTQEVKDCSKAKAATYAMQATPAIELKEELFPTTVKLDYVVMLRAAQLEAQGQIVRVVVGLEAIGTADIDQGAFGAKVAIKGLVKCSGVLDAKATARVMVRPDASLDVDLKDFELDWHKLCIPGAVQALTLTWAADPNAQMAMVFKRRLKAQIIKLLNRKIIDKVVEDDLKFGEKLRDATAKLRAPLSLGEDVSLLLRPKQIAVSQLKSGGSGADNALVVDAGILAKPVVVVGQAPPPDGPGTIPFFVRDLPSGFRLHVKGQISLAAAVAKLRDELRNHLNASFATAPYTIETTEIYQSGEKLVLRLGIVRRNGNARVGDVYISAKPVFDGATQRLQLTEAAIDVASRNILLKSAAWLLEAKLEKVIEQKAAFDLNEPAKRALQKVAKFETKTPTAIISGEVSKLKLAAIWIANDAINVLVQAEGEARVQLIKVPIQ